MRKVKIKCKQWQETATKLNFKLNVNASSVECGGCGDCGEKGDKEGCHGLTVGGRGVAALPQGIQDSI